MPAYAAALVTKYSRLLGVHLNDGYGKRDDGLMVASVHPIQTLELLWALGDAGYDGALYFDTFPDTAGMDPVAECAGNIAVVTALRKAASRLRGDARLRAAIANQDAVAAQGIVRAALYGQ
jgi:xylose isomerase